MINSFVISGVRYMLERDRLRIVAGDECLRRIADLMTGIARRPADLVARFGGEEFGVVLPETAGEGAFAVADRLREQIQGWAFEHAGSPTGVLTISGGCATLVPTAGSTATGLLTAADGALYRAKDAGRNRVERASVPIPASRVI